VAPREEKTRIVNERLRQVPRASSSQRGGYRTLSASWPETGPFLSRARLGKAVRGDLNTAAYWYRRTRDLGSVEAEALLKTIRK
jgi:uncharacterized protein YcbK (DUF882 family)